VNRKQIELYCECKHFVRDILSPPQRSWFIHTARTQFLDFSFSICRLRVPDYLNSWRRLKWIFLLALYLSAWN